jgi:hypothetical protein
MTGTGMDEISFKDKSGKNCRPCEIAVALIMLVPLGVFVAMGFISDDAHYWGFLGIIIGLPLALVATKILFMDSWSQSRALVPAPVLYLSGILCCLGPFYPHPNYAAVGIGVAILRLARYRQLQARERIWR